ncbi:MurT ligase domain-containing protein [Candidatus Solincola sp.]|nr:MurT ligase domain-containing protein [Actinomycetota bacterium]MDI7250986.1 MurT ligase domain-containing protein [Actinomycetota bacterium]
MDVRLTFAVVAGKAATTVSRRLGLGAGSNFPGRVVLRLHPRAPEKMASRLERGCVLVTGTNGKTTTSNLLAAMLREAGLRPVHNRVGANLISGITAALAQSSDRRGNPQGDIGLFEVDEATLPAAVKRLRPRMVIVTNLFRDQLDRYGELETLARKMDAALRELEPGSRVLLNADDPLVASLAKDSPADLYYYGIESEEAAEEVFRHAADSKHCRACGAPLAFSVHFFGHMGKYSCPGCGASRPRPSFTAVRVELRGAAGTEVTVSTPAWEAPLHLPVPGLYNVYNLLAALAGAQLLGISREEVERGVRGYVTAFGRGERIPVEGRELFLVLSKNPTGFNEVIRTVRGEGEGLVVLAALNDRIADGRDVSWIWDVDFEELAPLPRILVATGTRALDMALRMKYAGMEEGRIEVHGKLKEALRAALSHAREGETVYALTTYTATLELRRLLIRLGAAPGLWEGGGP